MSANFQVQPIGRFAGASAPVKRPKEFVCFSYDEAHQLHLDDSSLKYYYTPQIGADLSKGFQTFEKLDDTADEHIDSLLKAIMEHEKETGKKIDANIVTWRGMMTKIMASPFEARDGFEMNATLYQDCLFIEEHKAFKLDNRTKEPRRPGPSHEQMAFWGYKFETLATLPKPWAETSRDYIENRENEIVNNKAQYCSVVRTGIGSTTLCLGGEVDAIWDSKPLQQGSPINWVELKTSREIRDAKGMDIFHEKLMKYWIQSFLLGVPKIIVGFRTPDGVLVNVQEFETHRIPGIVNAAPRPRWNADMCVNFASAFLEWLRGAINGPGVWKIRRRANDSIIEVLQVEESGYGNILPDEFVKWRTELAERQAAETSM